MRRLPPGTIVTFTKLRKKRISRVLEARSSLVVDSPTVENNPLLRPPLGRLLLFLLFDFGGLRFYFAGTGERAVDLDGV
jgi:hypothetical protein